jgi:predicted nucleotidyltransferase
MKKKYQKEIQRIVEALKFYKPEKIILFGSAASGKFHSGSDIDICLIKKGDRIKIKRGVWNLLRQAGYSWEIEPDIHVYDPAVYTDWLKRGDPFIKEIEKGKVFYER